jgi:hypothetical protein
MITKKNVDNAPWPVFREKRPIGLTLGLVPALAGTNSGNVGAHHGGHATSCNTRASQG